MRDALHLRSMKCTYRRVHMRKSVSIVEARQELGRLAEEVRRTGKSVALTRRGRVIARIAPDTTTRSRGGGALGDALGALKGSIRIVASPGSLERDIRRLRREAADALERRARAFPAPRNAR
jgi:antitoxin (DNA-binding transcriptional repressor) of toxin-antitoxin stability system